MSSGIRIAYRVIKGITIPIKGLRICGIGHNRIGCNKPPQGRVIVPGFVEVEAGAVVQFLAGILVGHVRRARVGVGFSIGIVNQVFFLGPAGMREDTGGAQMIGVEITD